MLKTEGTRQDQGAQNKIGPEGFYPIMVTPLAVPISIVLHCVLQLHPWTKIHVTVLLLPVPSCSSTCSRPRTAGRSRRRRARRRCTAARRTGARGAPPAPLAPAESVSRPPTLISQLSGKGSVKPPVKGEMSRCGLIPKIEIRELCLFCGSGSGSLELGSGYSQGPDPILWIQISVNNWNLGKFTSLATKRW